MSDSVVRPRPMGPLDGSLVQPCRRVAVVGLDASAAGSVPAIVRMQAELLSTRYDVTLLTRSGPAGPLPFDLEQVDAPLFHGLRRFGHCARELVTSRRLIRRLLHLDSVAHIDVAVFHSHTLAALGARRAAEFGIRSVVVAHSDIRKRPKGTYDPLLTALYRWSNPAAYRRVDRVVALCREFGDLARQDATGPGRVREIPCPVSGPWPAVGRLAAVESGSSVRIGFVGRIAIEKGLPILIAAFKRLLETKPGSRLRIAGDGGMRHALEVATQEQRARGTVEFVGWKTGRDLEEFYQGLDLLCLPSISENQGVVAQEALLRGVPVVATRVGGLADSIRPGRDGELCLPGDAVALAEALERCIARLETGGYRVPDADWMSPYSPAGHLSAFGGLVEELAA